MAEKSKKEKLSIIEVEHIADLARIKLTESEKIKYTEDLSAVLSYIDQLSEVNTDNIPIAANADGLINAVREDKAEDCDVETKEKIIASAPLAEKGYIKVKAVM